MASLDAIAAALAAALAPIADVVDDLTISAELDPSLTPPCIDIYPADPPQDEGAGFGEDSVSYWTVRARVGAVDSSAQQALLRSLMEPAGPTSVKGMLIDDQTLAGVVETLKVETQTGFRLIDGGPMVGVLWRATIYNTETVYS